MAAKNRFLYLPLFLPAGVSELRVRYEVLGDARIDIGIFGPADSSIPDIGSFRGWSGSARDRFIIRARDATPGYLSGTIRPGRWWLVLGLYVVNETCTVNVEVEASRRTSSEPLEIGEASTTLEEARKKVGQIAPLRQRSPLRRTGDSAWLRGDLHCHTNHSNDAMRPMSVAEAIAAGEIQDLDFLAITDHNTISHWGEMSKFASDTSITLIRGQEVTTYRGHFNAFGAREMVEFRVDSDELVSMVLSEISEIGGLCSVNHPKKVGPPWEYELSSDFAAVEAWQAPWAWMNWESLEFWTRLLDEGLKISGIGGSDIHDLTARPGHFLATPTTWVLPSGEGWEGILAGIRAGRCMISEEPGSVLPIFEAHEFADDWYEAPGTESKPARHLRVRLEGDCNEIGMCARCSGGIERWWYLSGSDVTVDLGALEAEMGWIRIELWHLGNGESRRTSGQRLIAVTNPLYSK